MFVCILENLEELMFNILDLMPTSNLVARPAFEAVWVELADVEDVDGALDAEVMQLARHFEE